MEPIADHSPKAVNISGSVKLSKSINSTLAGKISFLFWV